MCGMSLGDGIDAVDPLFKNELTRAAAPDDTWPSPPLLPPPLPGAPCARGFANASPPALLAGALAVVVALFPRRSPSILATCSPVLAAGTAEKAAAAAATAADTRCAGTNGFVARLAGLTTADCAAAAAASGAGVSKVSDGAVMAAGAGASTAGAAAATGILLCGSRPA